MPRSHAVARRSYDRLSRWYDLIEEPFERSARRLGLGLLDPRSGESILEIGCGTGHTLVALAAAVGVEGHITGVDLSPGMIRQAAARVARAGLSASVELRVDDATALHAPDAAYDAVFMSFVLELFDTPEIPTVLGEVRRVLRPGGRVVVVALARPDRPGLAVRLYERVHDLLPSVVDCRPVRPAAALAAAGLAVEAVRGSRLMGLPVEVALARSMPDASPPVSGTLQS